MNYEEIVQPQEFRVENVFKGMEYVVPIYQRNYAWTKDEIEQLLNDINDVPEGFMGKYYLGSLIVNQLGANVFEVIDGQQRLTTLFLLLSFLNSHSVNKNSFSVNKNSLRFEAREKSNRTLNGIDAIKKTTEELEKEPWYSIEIIEGYSVIRKYFDGNDNLSKFQKKLDNVMIIRIQVPKDIDLNHYFEIMNTRGEQLELHEIVKAKIIGAIKTGNTITETDKKDKMIAATIWDACAQMDKYVQMSFSVDKRKKLFDEKDWDTFKCESFDDIRTAFIDEKYTDENSFTLRSKLLNPTKSDGAKDGKDDEENERFESIITFPNFILQVNEAMNISEADNDAGLDDKRFIELLKEKWSSKDKALEFIYCLLKYRYLFDRFIIKREYVGQYRVEGKWSLQRLEMYRDSRGTQKPSYKATLGIIGNESDAEEYEDDDNKRLRLLQSCMRITYTSPKTMHWIARVIEAANEGKDGKAIIQLLEKYCCTKVDNADYKGRIGFKIDRIVFTYLDYILCRDNATEFKDFQFQFRTSIEHFFPQNPINGENTVDEKNRDSFGNLALITVSANSKFSNMLPIHKVEQYNDVIKQSPKLMRMKKLLDENNRVWDDAMVEKHNDDMLDLLEREINQHMDGVMIFINEDKNDNRSGNTSNA